MLEERGADHTRDLELVRQEASRAGQIVRNLLAFVRKGSSERVRADLNQIARATASLREHHLAQENVLLRLELHPGVLPVLVNREEIQQVVLNLVLNAEHALGENPGTITIRTDAGEHAHTLQVSDDGPGISPELRGRVFEPFFTTKDVGKGTGLGLSLGLGIATAHGGSLELLDAEEAGGRGATFRLTLPAQRPIEAPPAAAIQPAPAAAAGRRQALVIEDERPIRDLLVRLLARRDYSVSEAASCGQAKSVSEGRTFDLVLCDVRLEDGSGADCLRHLSARQPAIGRRFIFVTGDSTVLADLGDECSGLPVLPKPFTVADLERVLGDIEVGATL
jgi:two-component system NtrC family sensor kinase